MIDKECRKILDKYHEEGGSVVSLLQDIQEVFGYIREDAINWFAGKLNMPESSFYGVATFYAQFYLKPRGENIITACCGTACHVKGPEGKVGFFYGGIYNGKCCMRGRMQYCSCIYSQ